MTNGDLLKLGFTEAPYFTIGDNMLFDLGRRRRLIATCVGQGNESLWLCETCADSKDISDLVCLHNRDYDGALTVDKVKKLLDWFEVVHVGE